MIISAIKCDHCMKVLEIKDIPEGWATIGYIVSIKGTPHGENNPIRKEFKARRDALIKNMEKVHYCPDCIEFMLKGSLSVKLDFKGE